MQKVTLNSTTQRCLESDSPSRDSKDTRHQWTLFSIMTKWSWAGMWDKKPTREPVTKCCLVLDASAHTPSHVSSQHGVPAGTWYSQEGFQISCSSPPILFYLHNLQSSHPWLTSTATGSNRRQGGHQTRGA